MPSRAAFTLVELLAVIMIIAMLAALVTPAVMRALASARNAAIKAEIDMLHMAIMNYKNEYGAFPPSTTGTFGITGNDPASRHLLRLFPRIGGALASGTQIQGLPYLNNPTSFPAALAVTPDTALVAWLYGYTDDPTAPILSGAFSITGGTVNITPPLATRRKLFDFDSSRIAGYRYHPSGKRGSPYIYINSSQYSQIVPISVRFSGTLLFSGTNATQLAEPGAHLIPTVPLVARPTGYPSAWWFTNTNAPLATTQSFFNPDTFQILCAGYDEQFGTDDDLSNFWPSTRQDYLDRLRN